MLTFEEKQKNGLLKKFHALAGKVGMDKEAKLSMLWCNYGVESARDLSVAQLIEVCNVLDRNANPKLKELDKCRKRLMASIGAYLKVMNYECNAAKIKAVACNATNKDYFNDIPLYKLRSLYNAFITMKKDLKMVEGVTAAMLGEFAGMN